MHESLNSVLEFDHDSDESTDDYTFEIGGIIPILYGLNSYRAGDYGFSNKYSYYTSYEQLCFNGPRVAQYWLANNPDYEDIVMVCNAQENWIWMPDGTNGVADYFNLNYENGRVDYETQVEQSEAWRKPTTPAAVHDSIHYNQIGYNEVGRESVRNALVMLGEKEADDIEMTVELLSWDGYTEVEHIEARAAGSSGTLVVPKVYPLWKAKDVTYSLSDGLDWAYYDIIAETKCVNGALSTGTEGKSVAITGHDWSEWETLSEPTEDEVGEEMRTCFACGAVQTRVSEGVWQKYNLADHLAEQPEDICLGINLWDVLEHDEQYFANGTNWGKHASGKVHSVTFLINEGDRIFSTSFGKAGENGGTTTSGIRMTFFDAYGIARSMSPDETYAEFSKNGYLTAPDGAIAVNIPVWDYNYDNEIYVLSAEHTYTATVTSPTGTEQGYTTYTCHCGDSYIDSYVDATGHEEGEWIIDLEAEVGAEGKKHKECVICHEVLEVAVIEALTHEEQPTEEPTEQPTDEPDEQPTEEVTEQPTEDVTEQPTDEVTEQPTEDATEQLTDVASEEKGCNSSLSFSLAIFTAISLVALLKKRKRT